MADQLAGFDPVRDTIDIALVTLAVYWMLLLIRGTRAVQILIGLMLLLAASLASQAFELTTLQWILDNFLASAVLIIIVLFQADIRRALARVGRGVFPVAKREETQLAEEVARAAQSLAQKGVGALFVIERETHLSDLIEAGTPIDAAVKRDLLVALFLPQSPLHDGAVVIQGGRIAQAGCILPLTLREDLPEGVGTRHRAAVGITEESDAVVIVVSEETRALSLVVGGRLVRGLDGARLREVLRDVLIGGDTERAVMAQLTGGAGPRAGERIGEPAADRA
ncbi:MAG: TIGR00159 family protein [Proteobacteria bacterium]|nr:MAG: TIGR00159 family protein [Pseudomonadota bacterium]